jgi:hypothetical protein
MCVVSINVLQELINLKLKSITQKNKMKYFVLANKSELYIFMYQLSKVRANYLNKKYE